MPFVAAVCGVRCLLVFRLPGRHTRLDDRAAERFFARFFGLREHKPSVALALLPRVSDAHREARRGGEARTRVILFPPPPPPTVAPSRTASDDSCASAEFVAQRGDDKLAAPQPTDESRKQEINTPDP
jgi:hypothetical protein